VGGDEWRFIGEFIDSVRGYSTGYARVAGGGGARPAGRAVCRHILVFRSEVQTDRGRLLSL
jgi:hypothetical protein